MAGRRGDTHRVIRWLWTSRRIDARLARLALLPASMLWRVTMGLRRQAYARGWFETHDLPLPSVGVGNLTVGGSGKTPIAIWIARYYASHGFRPGILLRGHGGDETLVHSRSVPEAVVVPDPDGVAGA
jgi:tetraacyldisaccharide 4'-kinase